MEPDKKIKEVIAEPPPEEASEEATLEAVALADLREYRRDERVKDHLHWATIGGFWTFFVGVLLMAIVWFWHLVTPYCMHYLSEQQMGELKTILVTAATSAAMTRAARRMFGNDT